MYNVEELKKQVLAYYEEAATTGFPIASIMVDEVNRMNDEEIIKEARRLHMLNEAK